MSTTTKSSARKPSPKKGMSNRQKWKVTAYFLLALQIILSIVAVVVLGKSKMFPVLYLVFFFIVLWLLLFMAYALMLLVKKRKGQKKSKFYMKRGLGVLISSLTMIACIMASSMVSKLNSTINGVAISSEVVITDTVSVYVPITSPAEEITDLEGAVFGLTAGFDYENSQATMEDIQEKIGEVQVQEFESVFDTVDALRAGTIDAMVMNITYEEIIVDMEGYETFVQDTKVVYQHMIETVVEQAEVEAPKDVTKDVFAIYCSGSDTRTSKLSKSRSDVNIIAFVNPVEKQVLLVNTPRDYYIPISVSSSGACDKLTHCGLYGFECSMDSLGALYDTKINYYMQINFNGFMTLVDAIGGVTVESDKTFVTTHYNRQIYEGMNELDGEAALGFARERYAFADGDNTRGINSMRLIKAIIEKMSSGTTILTNYGEIMDSMEGMFATSLSSDEMAALVRMQLSDMSSWDVRSYAVTGTGDSRTTYSVPSTHAYVMIPDQDSVDKAIELINKFESGERLTDADFE